MTRADLLEAARVLRGHGSTAPPPPDGAGPALGAPPACGAPSLLRLHAIAASRGWHTARAAIDREVFADPASFEASHATEHTRIFYSTSGPNAVPTDRAGTIVYIPYSTVTLQSLPADRSVPTYVRRLGIYLEHAFRIFCDDFGFDDPTAGGTKPVTVTVGTGNPTAGVHLMTVGPAYNDALLCGYASHELFHVFQLVLKPPETWRPYEESWSNEFFEGGAVFAEDATASAINRYLVETANVFNGIGLLANPAQSLRQSGYKTAVWWRYLIEQAATDAAEPAWCVYRRLIAAMGSGWITSDLERVVADVPGFNGTRAFRIARVENARDGDIVAADTLLGNFALACYLKDVPLTTDRRFRFAENAGPQNFYHAVTGQPPPATPPRVELGGRGSLSGGGVSFERTVKPFGHHFFEVDIPAGVPAVDVDVTGDRATAGHSLVQLVELCVGIVRDIGRSDRPIRRRITVIRDGATLTRLLVVVSGTDLAWDASFSVTVSRAAAAPDVMITRWNCRARTTCEIDPRATPPTWRSPDIAIDGRDDLQAGTDNTVVVTVHNRGAVDATGVALDFTYQAGERASLRARGWLPVLDASGQPSHVTGLAIPAGGIARASVTWTPPTTLAGSCVCLRVQVTAPGDPNTDDKVALSMLGCRGA